MKKKIIILVDGENVSCKKADKIIALSSRLGHVMERKVYHLQKDPATRRWTETSKNGAYKDICLYGGPEKDKVDHKMQKDALRYMRTPDVDIVCVVTSDGGFCCLGEETGARKKLCFMGEKKAPKKLRNAGVKFMELD